MGQSFSYQGEVNTRRWGGIENLWHHRPQIYFLNPAHYFLPDKKKWSMHNTCAPLIKKKTVHFKIYFRDINNAPNLLLV